MISSKKAFLKIFRACAFPVSVLTTGRYWWTVLKLAGWAVLIFAVMFALYCLVGGAVGWRHLAECWGEFTSGTDWVPDLGEERYGASSRLFAAAFVVRLAGLVFFGGVFISAVTNLFLNVSDERTRGLFRYRRGFFRDHFVIIGNGEETEALIRAIFKGDENFGAYSGEYIVIMTHADVERARERLFSELESEGKKRGGIVFYYGDLDSKECLDDVAPWNAREIFVLGDATDVSGRDVRNMSAMRLLNDIVGEHRGKACVSGKCVPVNVQICGVSTYSAIQKLDSFDRGVQGSAFEYIVPRVFNLYENWARRLWGFFGRGNDGEYRYRDLDYLPICTKDNRHYVHLVVVGLNQMGLALVLEALRICHYANFDESAEYPKEKKKTRITIVDRDPSRELFFKANYPNLSQIYDVDVDFVSAEIESPEARRIIVKSARDCDCLLTVAICFGSDDVALAAGLSLPEIVFEYQDKDKSVTLSRLAYVLEGERGNAEQRRSMKEGGNTVLIRQTTDRNEISRKLDLDKDRYKYVRRFGYASSDFDSDLLNDELAKCVNVLYENWQVLSVGDEEAVKNALAGKEAAWSGLSEYKRWSNRFQVDSYRVYLNTLGYAAVKTKDGKTTPEEREAFKKLDAFRKYATVLVEGGEILAGEGEAKEEDDELFSRIADMEHRRWVAERTLAGTRSFDVDFRPRDVKEGTEEEAKEVWAWESVQDKVYRRHACLCSTKKLSERQDRLEALLKEKLSDGAKLREIFGKKIAKECADASEAAEKLEKELAALEAARRRLAVRRLKRLEEQDVIPVANMPALLKRNGYHFRQFEKKKNGTEK
ncbi:MAG: hypothetical protein ACI4QA_03300 [Candidatus Spyradosoma sp.]